MKVGVVPFREKAGRIEICLISSRSKPGQITFPKGIVKSGEALEKAALRELYEEAGLKGEILFRRTPLLLSPRKRPEETCVFFWCRIDTVKKSWPEQKIRDRQWHKISTPLPENLTRNAIKIYRQLLKLGLDQEHLMLNAERLLAQQIKQAAQAKTA